MSDDNIIWLGSQLLVKNTCCGLSSVNKTKRCIWTLTFLLKDQGDGYPGTEPG